MKTAGKKQKKITKPILWIVLIIIAIIQIFPLIWLIDFSLASSNEMFTSGLLIIPKKIQWGNYVKAFVDGHFLLYFKNSIHYKCACGSNSSFSIHNDSIRL